MKFNLQIVWQCTLFDKLDDRCSKFMCVRMTKTSQIVFQNDINYNHSRKLTGSTLRRGKVHAHICTWVYSLL